MSFILDALRKAEAKRKTQDQTGMQALYEASEQKPRKSRWWLILLLTILVLNGLLILWMTTVRRDSTMEAQVVQLPAVAPPQSVDPANPVPAPAVAVESVVIAQPETLPVSSTTAPAVDSSMEKILVPAAIVSPEVIPVKVDPSAVIEAVPAPRLYAVTELPTNLRSRVSALQMAMHAYNANNPPASMVQIDGRLLRAGGQIGHDLTVEEIIADGVILHSGGYRFLLPRRGQ